MSYRLRYTEEAKQAMARLPGRYRQRARRLVSGLAQNPRPDEAEELRDLPSVYRVWVNGWRLIWQVDDETETVLVIGVRKKTGPETYGDLPLG